MSFLDITELRMKSKTFQSTKILTIKQSHVQTFDKPAIDTE